MSDSLEEILIYGSQSFAKTLTSLVGAAGFQVSGYIDDFNKGPRVLGDFNRLVELSRESKPKLALGIGYNDLKARADLIARLQALEIEFPKLIHPASSLDPSALVGDGSLVMRGAVLDVRVELGRFSVVWPGAIVNHDSRIGDNCFISPGAIICGDVTIGSHCFIGAGAIIADGRTVPDYSFVKAGSLVK